MKTTQGRQGTRPATFTREAIAMRILFFALIAALALPYSAAAADYKNFDKDFASDVYSKAPYRSSYLIAALSESVYDSGGGRKKKSKASAVAIIEASIIAVVTLGIKDENSSVIKPTHRATLVVNKATPTL